MPETRNVSEQLNNEDKAIIDQLRSLPVATDLVGSIIAVFRGVLPQEQIRKRQQEQSLLPDLYEQDFLDRKVSPLVREMLLKLPEIEQAIRFLLRLAKKQGTTVATGLTELVPVTHEWSLWVVVTRKQPPNESWQTETVLRLELIATDGSYAQPVAVQMKNSLEVGLGRAVVVKREIRAKAYDAQRRTNIESIVGSREVEETKGVPTLLLRLHHRLNRLICAETVPANHQVWARIEDQSPNGWTRNRAEELGIKGYESEGEGIIGSNQVFNKKFFFDYRYR